MRSQWTGGRRCALAVGVFTPLAGIAVLFALLLVSVAYDFVLHRVGDRGADLSTRRPPFGPFAAGSLPVESKSWSGARGTLTPLRVFSAHRAPPASGTETLGAIPRRVLTTAPTWWVAPGLKRAVASFVSRNGAFVSERFDDAEQRAMVANEEDPRTLEAFDALVPTAFRADIWRLVALKLGGGVYHDAKMLCVSRNILFTVTFHANPAHDLTCPPSSIMIEKDASRASSKV